VCKSGRQSVEFENGAVETLYFGKDGNVTVRLYDNLAEVQPSCRTCSRSWNR
jgi:predicted Zn-dependent protease